MKIDFNNSEDNKKFFEELVKTESAEEVKNLFKKYDLWDNPNYWRFYGDVSNNMGIINNQSKDGVKALVEKITNSFDARLLLECQLEGLNPKDREKTPKNISDAMDRFFYKKKNTKYKDFLSLEDETVIFSTGTKDNPCITLVDKGEGQIPKKLPQTILSLNKENKEGVFFTQGKYNQGGSGALNFCEDGVSLIVSRRHPDLIKNKESNTDDQWGFTVTRILSAKERNLPEPAFVYFVPSKTNYDESKKLNGVASFKSNSLKLLPKDSDPYINNLEHGTFIKLYGYKMSGADQNIMFDLLYNTEIMMPDAIMPIRLHECREIYKKRKGTKDYRSQVTTLQGFLFRNKDSDSLEEDYPIIMPIDFYGFKFKVYIFAFKYRPAYIDEKGKKHPANYPAKRRRKNNEGIVFCISGQHYGDRKSSFFSLNDVGLDYLRDDLIVIVDCTGIDGDLKNKLFKADKDTIYDTKEFEELDKILKELLSNNTNLNELKNLRRKQKIDEKLSDDKPFEQVLKNVIKNSPNLAALFKIGNRLSNPFNTETGESSKKDEEVKLNYYPTYFKFKKKLKEDQINIRTINLNKKIRLDFLTDAENDYFIRKKDPGNYEVEIRIINKHKMKNLLIDKSKIISANYLNKGHWLLSTAIPDNAEIGDTIELIVSINDSNQKKPWILKSEIIVESPSKPRTHDPDEPRDKKNKSTGFSIPHVTLVDKSKWGEYDFDEFSALKCINAGRNTDGQKEIESYDFFLNIDNKYLLTDLKNSKGTDEKILKKRYELALVFFALSLIDQAKSKIKKDSDILLDIENFTRGISPVVLSIIETLGDSETLGSSVID